MAKFTAKVLLLICTLLFGILLGIQQAEHGILAIAGIPSIQESGQAPSAETNAGTETEKARTPPEEPSERAGDEGPLGEIEILQDKDYYITHIDGQEVRVKVIGETLDLDEKQEQWDNLNRGNRYSNAGNKIGNVIYTVSRTGVEWFVDIVDRVL